MAGSSPTLTASEQNGIPGVEKIPLLKYLFATETKDRQEGELIIVITPHIVRLPDFADSDLESLAIMGSGISPRFIGKPVQLGNGKAAESQASSARGGNALRPFSQAQLRHRQQPPVNSTAICRKPARPKTGFRQTGSLTAEVNTGGKLTVAVSIENAQDASAASFALSFNPKVLKLVTVQDGGFLSQGGNASSLSPSNRQ